MVTGDRNLSNMKDNTGRRSSCSSLVAIDLTRLIIGTCNALDQGLIIVSKEGKICYYNTAYSRLRQIHQSEMIGHRFEDLDRRKGLRQLLQLGTLPEELPVVLERRRNREKYIPIHEEGKLLGITVLVAPVDEISKSAVGRTDRRALGNRGGEPIWPARCIFADIIGNSPGFTQAKELALRAAQGKSSVLLLGESGTGKELFAQAIHAASCRRDFPFVPVDCSAIPRELLEAELFGYAPGAFTGASKEGKPGKFELARGGTILLDEIGEMPLELQAKLLRVLQERQIMRVGGTVPIPGTFSVIAATNRDLESLVAMGRFRRDLLYRLDIIRIEIPPLRERPEDIPLLVDYYWDLKQRELGKSAKLSAEALRVLEAYTWPGNVREVANLIERLLVTVSKPIIEPQDLPPVFSEEQLRSSSFAPFQLELVSADAERRTLERALDQARGNRNKAAQLVGLSRATLYRKLKQHKLTDLNRI